MDFTDSLLARTKELAKQVDSISFSFDGYIYNPLDYAWDAHALYLKRYVHKGVLAFFLGMNPGPYGMMQTGVPFGEVGFVKNWMGINVPVGKPEREHPNRPVLGFDCTRSEVSGKRLWGLFSEEYENVNEFFKANAVFNYCPLGFLESGKTAKNFTPNKLKREERAALEGACDAYLKYVLELGKPRVLVGVGKYAQAKLVALNEDPQRQVISIIHPSPGNPQSNNGWAQKTVQTLEAVGVWKCQV